MLVKISASCIWNVSEEDEKVAKELIDALPGDIILDYLEDALTGNDKELINFEVSVEEVE